MEPGRDHDHELHHDDYNRRELDQEIAQLIEETDWDLLTKRLLAYTRYRLSRHGSHARVYVNRADDYVQDAVTSWMEGTRRFLPAADKTLFRFLCGVVDSMVSHDAEKTRRRPRQMALGTSDGEDASGHEVDEEHLRSDDDFEQRIILRNELARFMATLDPELEEYVRLRAGELHGKAQEYANALGTTVSEIRNLDRRLRRRRNACNL